jgi:hypothetical protein
MLEPDRDQLEIFVSALFCRAGPGGYVSLRSFLPDSKVLKPIRAVAINGDGSLVNLIDVAEDQARRAAQSPAPAVFCPPIAVFNSREGWQAREQDLYKGLALSAECDQDADAARWKLEEILGPATVVVRSGGTWMSEDGPRDKLHLHWRLNKPAEGDALSKLKQARVLATAIVGADPTNVPVVHCLRWPGSWHRKGDPRLCEIFAVNPDAEIDLDAALAALTAAAPPIPQRSSAGSTASPEDWGNLIGDIVAGRNLHGSIARLAAKHIRSGTSAGAAVNLLRSLMDNSAARQERPKEWQNRYDDIPRAVETAEAKYGAAPSEGQAAQQDEQQQERSLLHAYIPRPFCEIPRRRWLHAGHYIRRQVVMTVAPGGYGKTALVLCNTLEMCTDRGLIGPAPIEGRVRVLYWNAEDPEEEVERRAAALCIHYQINQADLEGYLFLGSKIANGERLARLDRKTGEVILNAPLFDLVGRFIAEHKIDCAIFDPLIAFHAVPENDNGAMEKLVKSGFEQLAIAQNICVELSQHTRKSTQGEITADDSRGAGATTFAARSVRVLNRMSERDAELPKIEPEERRHYLRVSRDKTNLAPPGKATWVHLVDVELPNGDGGYQGDHVQVATAWDYPQPFDGMNADDMRHVRDLVRTNPNYRYDPRSPDWLGVAVATRLKLNPTDKGDRKRIGAIIRAWIVNKALSVELRRDDSRHEREYMILGSWNDDTEEGNEP